MVKFNLFDFDLVNHSYNREQAEAFGFINSTSVAVLRTGATTTTNMIYSPNVGIYDTEGKCWDAKAWNKRYADNGFSTEGLSAPAGFWLRAGGRKFALLWPWQGSTYEPTGTTKDDVGSLQHSPYNMGLISASASGTDYAQVQNTIVHGVAGGKYSAAWSVVANSDGTFALKSDNTGRTFTLSTSLAAAASFRERSHDILGWCRDLLTYVEWERDRMAICSGKSTTDIAEVTEVLILDADGQQASAGTDMYFWLSDGTNKVRTSLLAKYNLTNNHGAAAYNLTAAIRDAMYEAQKGNGVNMNDTGVNSESRPVLAPGCKGADAVLVDGFWYIRTPFISYAQAAPFTSAEKCIADAPAVACALTYAGEGYALPDQEMLLPYWVNKDPANNIIGSLRTYLLTEGHNIPALLSGGTWCSARNSASNVSYVSLGSGVVSSYGTYGRYGVLSAVALSDL